MKYITILLINLTMSLAIAAPEVGNGFSYQGKLKDNGTNVTGTYDFSFTLYDLKTGGSSISNTVDHDGIQVTDGIFTIDNLDFGDAAYTGVEIWLEIKVKIGGKPTYTTLSPLQRIGAVPHAIQAEYVQANAIGTNEIENSSITRFDLASNSVHSSEIATNAVGTSEMQNNSVTSLKIAEQAIGDREIADESISGGKIADNTIKASNFSSFGVTNGDIFQFNGTNWVTTALSGSTSPWTVYGSDINYQSGKVGINVVNPTAKLEIQSDGANENPLVVKTGSSTKLMVIVY